MSEYTENAEKLGKQVREHKETVNHNFSLPAQASKLKGETRT